MQRRGRASLGPAHCIAKARLILYRNLLGHQVYNEELENRVSNSIKQKWFARIFWTQPLLPEVLL
jgi:hypothetical protein